MKINDQSPRVSIFLGASIFVLFGALSIFHFKKEPYKLDSTLIEVTGRVTEAHEEGMGKHRDLLIQIEASDIHYRSPMAYPSAFLHGSKSVEILTPGTKIALLLEASEQSAPPKTHRIKGYEWREFVGLTSGDTVHLAPLNHQNYRRGNDSFGKFILPVFVIFGIIMIYDGIRKITAKSAKTRSSKCI